MADSERFDPEEIAALIDGKLHGAERSRAIDRLAGSPAAFDAFAEAVRFREEQRVAAGIEDLEPPAPRWRGWRPLAAAAAVALLVGAPVVWTTMIRSTGPVAAREVVAPLLASDAFRVDVGESWRSRSWSVTRGAPVRLVEPSLAFRLGVRAVDLEIALALGDTAAAAGMVGEMREWLGGVDMAQSVAARYGDLGAQLAAGASTTHLVAASHAAEGALEALLDSPSFPLGKWIGAAQVAARLRVTEFFESPDAARLFSGLDPERFPEVAGALRRVEDLLSDGLADAEYPELERLLDEVVRISAG